MMSIALRSGTLRISAVGGERAHGRRSAAHRGRSFEDSGGAENVPRLDAPLRSLRFAPRLLLPVFDHDDPPHLNGEVRVLSALLEQSSQGDETITFRACDPLVFEAIDNREFEVAHAMPRFEGQERPRLIERDRLDARKVRHDIRLDSNQ